MFSMKAQDTWLDHCAFQNNNNRNLKKWGKPYEKDMYAIGEQRRLRRTCAVAQPHQRLRYLHTQYKDQEHLCAFQNNNKNIKNEPSHKGMYAIGEQRRLKWYLTVFCY